MNQAEWEALPGDVMWQIVNSSGTAFGRSFWRRSELIDYHTDMYTGGVFANLTRNQRWAKLKRDFGVRPMRVKLVQMPDDVVRAEESRGG